MKLDAMFVRQAELSDALAIAKVDIASRSEAYSHLMPKDFFLALSAPQHQAKWSEKLLLGKTRVLVAEAGDALAGYIEFGPHETQAACCELISFYVHPHFWSRGIGKELWLAARAICQTEKIKEVFLWVLAQNPRGIRFYETSGFVRAATVSRTIERGGVQLQQARYFQHIGARTFV